MSTITDRNVIEVDFTTDDRPKYVVLEGAIRDAIRRGVLPAGTRLPATRDLAWRVGVTPGTVARAYSRLTDDGTLDAAVGRGTFVSEVHAPESMFRDPPPVMVDSTPHLTGGETDVVNLMSPHLPSVGQAALIRKLLADVAEDPPSGVMHYPVSGTERPVRVAAAHWLADPMLGPVDEAEIVVTNGGQNAIALSLQTILRGRRPVVALEELSYPGFRRAAEMLRADVVTVEMDAHGIIPASLAAMAQRHDVQVLCTSPEVHNPTLIFTPEARRREIVEVARTHDIQIIDDDCYLMGRAAAPGYRRLAPERTWTVSSIAKTITPALRLGFVVPPPAQHLALQRAVEYNQFGMATPMSDLAAKLLIHPDLAALQAETSALVARYVSRAVDILAGHDLVWRTDVPFLWLTLPVGWRASAFCRSAEAEGVTLRTADEYAGRDANSPHAVRLAINAGVSLRSFEAALVRLRALLDRPNEGLGV
ncbi:PLP-dependent aminotransferase family protein [Jannaschia donghaensis]|uniref:Putative HTH-type transcriptional regulator YjiR n=1 Tax=Jannaschia donghaensis TaxID=420998 RepID=A0A0M6YKS6_9RHOB|nr:PLP-dependent aminotransferase family protein [Jannaschia donghaensis]CTQ50972.1 putative HTH-type transcriptional regulator YjiR [Jannaschia donghaensis]